MQAHAGIRLLGQVLRLGRCIEIPFLQQGTGSERFTESESSIRAATTPMPLMHPSHDQSGIGISQRPLIDNSNRAVKRRYQTLKAPNCGALKCVLLSSIWGICANSIAARIALLDVDGGDRREFGGAEPRRRRPVPSLGLGAGQAVPQPL